MSSQTLSVGNVVARVRGQTAGSSAAGKKLTLGRQLALQALLLFIAFTVLFPLLWVVSLSLDPRNIGRPTDLRLIPPGASLQAYIDVIKQPTINKIDFVHLTLNSLKLAGGTAFTSVLVAILAAYSFSRFHFRGREALMLGVVTVLMLPSVATLPALYVLLNHFVITNPTTHAILFNLRDSLWGVGLAMISGMLPFAIWNIKGYLDTIPKELEEAATVDGAGKFQAFRHVILPLATPVLAVTAFFGFIAGWTEFQFSYLFLIGDTHLWTLAMALNGMVGQYAASTPWSQFAAFAILVALPVMVVYIF